MLDYWYDAQIRRYCLQFLRIFSGFKYETGITASGDHILRTVPATLASRDKQTANIINNNTENTAHTIPQFSVFIKSIEQIDERRQDPNFIRMENITERGIDPVTNLYTNKRGLQYTVESYMPVPYDLVLTVDLWTSNENQKHQLMEQILTLFNPSIDLQTSTNSVDWTALTIVKLTGPIEWTSTNFPVTTDVEITSINFTLPIWINPPSKVKRSNIITEIITNISQLNCKIKSEPNPTLWGSNNLLSTIITTPGNYRIEVSNNGTIITLLDNNLPNPTDVIIPNWEKLLEEYGEYIPNYNTLWLRLVGDNVLTNFSHLVSGTFSLNPTVKNQLIYNVDVSTLPTLSTLTPTVNAIINPTKTYPTGSLPTPQQGDRYLLLDNIRPGGNIWGNISANTNDIIEYNNSEWIVVFSSRSIKIFTYIKNLKSSSYWTWTGNEWINTIDACYNPGYWSLKL